MAEPVSQINAGDSAWDEVIVVPASYAQRRLWFLDQLVPGSFFYNVPLGVRLRGSLDRSVLARAVAEIVRRHESLRTTFAAGDDGPVQVIAPYRGVHLPEDDLSDLAADAREDRLARMLSDAAHQGFDLKTGPLLRCRLIRLGEQEHVLMLVFHHIVVDGWSMGAFFDELAALYSAFLAGLPSPLAEPVIQYADFSEWQRAPEQRDEQQRQLAYWRAQLATAPRTLDLPTDRPRPWARDVAGAVHQCELPPGLTHAAEQLERAEQASEFMVLMAAVLVLLHGYTGHTDICVGTPVAGRTRPELDGMIGFFVNTLVIRADLSGNPSFRDFLRQVRRTSLAAFDHQDVPFEEVVDELNPERSMSHSPLFEVMFVLQNVPDEERARLTGLDVTLIEPRLRAAKFDLTIMAWRTDRGGVGLSYEYSTDLFDAATIERLAANFEVLLAGAVADPDARLADLPLLGRDERRRLTSGGRQPGWRAGDTRLPDLFAEQALRNPGTVAIESGPERVTYRQLNEQANRLAHWLIARGAGPEGLVAVVMPRSAAQVTSLLAVLKAGAGYLPVDPDQPAERIAVILDAARPAVILTVPGVLSGPAAAEPAELLVLAGARAASALRDQPIRNPGPGDRLGPLTAASPAYAIYTSGSTGTPKGIVMPAGAIESLIAWHLSEIGSYPDARVVQFTSIGFDVSVQEVLSALLGAKTLVIPGEDVRRDPGPFARWLDHHQVTELYAPNLVIEALCQAADDEKIGLGALRHVAQAGEPLVISEAVRRFFEQRPGCRLHNHYGPTETHVVTALTMPRETAGWPVRPGIGRPIDGSGVYVLDQDLCLLPHGARGELFIAGAGLARGYLGRPALTAERFLPDRFGPPGSRMYRSADLARWCNDGTLDLLGRADDQVKIRGYRIEPGEIQEALVRHPGIREAVVLAHEDAAQGRRLVAYLVPAASAPPTAAALRTYLADIIPAYMVPVSYTMLDRLPLSGNGKLDRQALPEPELERTVHEPFVAPRDDIERVVSDIWGAVLGLPSVGVHDDFFQLGGHSLLAAQVLTRVRQATGRYLPLWTIFQAPTLAAFAEQVAMAAPELGGGAIAVDIPRRPRPPDAAAIFPAAFSQRRLLFLEQLIPGTPAYHIPAVQRLHGPLDISALERAIEALVLRHEPLRTTFTSVDGEQFQVVAPSAEFELPVERLDGTREQRWARALQRVDEEISRPFDLGSDLMVRARLLRLSADDHVLVVTVHHIAFDGWSGSVFFSELAALYEAYAQDRPSLLSLPSLPLQFADYAAWQHDDAGRLRHEAQLEFWARQLADAPRILELPTARPRPAIRTMAGAVYERLLPRVIWEKVEWLAGRERATPFIVLLAAFQALLSRYSGQSDICVGSPVAGRSSPELERLIGFFVNTLVLRGDVSGDPTFNELVRRTRTTTLDAFEHQDVPFERVVEELRPERYPGSTPLFQVMFALQNAPDAPFTLPGLTAGPVPINPGTAKFDLVLHVWPTPDGMVTAFEFSTDVFDVQTVERMAGHLHTLLQAALADPQRRVSELSLMGEAELRLVTRQEGRRPVRPAGDCLPDLIAGHAAARPEAIAVRCGTEALCYGRLTARANQLAHYLRGHGVGPEQPVAIYLDRGVDQLVAMLAVSTAGGAYVPLDPESPPGRSRFVIEDSAARALITTSSLAARLEGSGVRVICLDVEAEAIAGHPEHRPRVAIAPGNLAYIIYTSGSSGRPKGVMVSHANVLRLLAAAVPEFGFGPGDVWTMFHSFAFDFSVWEMWGAWAHGGTLVVVPLDVARSPRQLLELLRREGVTVLNLTPSALREMTAILSPATADPHSGDDELELRHVILGGEALAVGDLHAWADRMSAGRPRIANMYGITETTVHTTLRPLRAEDLAGTHRSPIGRPLADLRVYVLDRNLRPVPVGVTGELYVAGAGLARGYAGRAAMTAERFVPDPFGPDLGEPGARLYRTGDLARWQPDGDLDYLGRADAQLKLRGYRIEPAEIEAVLSGHPSVRTCAVIARPDPQHGLQLVAYLETAAPGGVSVSELRALLTGQLPEWMIPGRFVVVDSWPRTANGKLDVAALPIPGTQRREDGAYLPPETSTERRLAAIWTDLLRLDQVARHDNFFELGGHSFTALQLVARIEHEFGRRMSPIAVFQAPTVELLASRIVEQDGGGEQGPLVALRPGGLRRPLVLVHPIGGDVLCYAGLVQALDEQTPVYGLVAAGLDGHARPAVTIEDMAGQYVEAVVSAGITASSRGYVLAGWSMGGVVAYEMARQLAGLTGHHPPVVLIDSYPPEQEPSAEPGPVAEPGEAELLAAFAADWGRAAGRDLDVSAGRLASMSPEDRLAFLWQRASEAGLVSATDDPRMVAALTAVFRAHYGALLRYAPAGRYGGRLVLLAARAGRADARDPYRAWQAWTSQCVTGAGITADHYGLLRGPGLAQVSGRLQVLLRPEGTLAERT